MNRTHKIALNIFKILIITVILFNLMLRGASGHQFYLPIQELLGYSVMLLSIILISVYPSIHGVFQKPVKYTTVISLIGVLIFAFYLSEDTFSIDYQDWYIAILSYLFDAAFIGITVYVLFLVLFDKVRRI